MRRYMMLDPSRCIFLSVLLSSAAVCASQPPKTFVNDICLPSSLYMLSDTQNDIFVKPFIKRWRPYNDYVRFSSADGKQPFMRRMSHVASIDKPVDGSVLSVDLVNGDEFETVKSVKTTLRVGKKSVGDKDVCIQIVGDSVTRGRFFEHALLATNYVPKLSMVGLLKCGENQYNEGRGGWTLYWYFQPPTKAWWAYHGFMQPAEGRYWGARGFWKVAWQCVRGTQPAGFEPAYSCSRYDDVVHRFDEKTGILLNPREGDIQYDNDAEKFVRYDGAGWKTLEKDALTWSFDYGKYLEMWNIKRPDFLFLSLGPNDFRYHLDADFSRWANWIETFRKSYLKACPGGRFVVCIPITVFGPIDNTKGEFTPYQHAAMWRFRDWLIKNYDNREKDRLYLLDGALALDDDYGFNPENGPSAVPFAMYEGKDRLKAASGNSHPYSNYPAMGIPFAAFIQYHR